MSIARTSLLNGLLAGLLLIPFLADAAESPQDRIEITGEYRYATHSYESIADAKQLACREALRLAVVNSSLYREHTASMIDSPLLRNIAYELAARHVQDQQVLEQFERGRTISCRVRGFLQVEESARVIRTELAGGPPVSEGLDQNRVLRILSVKEEPAGILAIQYQALTRLDWLGTHYQGGLRGSAEIMVDFYDKEGLLIFSERHQARRTPTGDDIMNPGAVGIITVPKPATAKTFRVWLVK